MSRTDTETVPRAPSAGSNPRSAQRSAVSEHKGGEEGADLGRLFRKRRNHRKGELSSDAAAWPSGFAGDVTVSRNMLGPAADGPERPFPRALKERKPTSPAASNANERGSRTPAHSPLPRDRVPTCPGFTQRPRGETASSLRSKCKQPQACCSLDGADGALQDVR